MQTVYHNIEPVFDKNSKVLILGSFPSVKSRESEFFYGHPQNRFWKVTAAVFGENVPLSVDDKTDFLLRNRIALWDVISRCDIEASSDSSIKNVVANDINRILLAADIKKIFVNGKAAEKYYNKYLLPVTEIQAVCLPSTSPANAAFSLENLIGVWQIIKVR